MKDIATINEFFKGYKIPVTKTPVLKWKKTKPNKSEVKLGFSSESPIEMYCNLETGDIGYYLSEVVDSPANASVIERVSRDLCRYYCEYIPELDGFVLGQAKINARSVKMSDIKVFAKYKKQLKDTSISIETKMVIERIMDSLGVMRKWEKCGEVFISSNKELAYSDCGWFYDYSQGRYHWGNNEPMVWHEKLNSKAPFKIDNITDDIVGINGETFKELIKPLLNVFPRICNVGGNKTVDISKSGITLATFLKYKEPKGRQTKTKSKIDKLIAVSIPEICYNDDYNENMAFIQKVETTDNTPMCVVRTMVKNSTERIMVDGARIYVTKKNVIACRPTNDGRWIDMRLNSQAIHWDFTLEDFDVDIVKGTKLEYFGSIVKDVSPQVMGKYIWALLTYPVIEQLSKQGFKDMVIARISNVSYGNIIESLSLMFGDIENKKSLTNSLGINKYQLKKFSEILNSSWYCEDCAKISWYYNHHLFTPIPYMKRIFGENLKDIDNDTFDTTLQYLLDAHNEIKKFPVVWESWHHSTYMSNMVTILSLLKETFSISAMKKMAPSLILLIRRKCEVEARNRERFEREGYYSRNIENSPRHLEDYKDYLDMVKQLNDTVHFRPEFDECNLDSIKDMHDMVMEVFLLKKRDIEDKKFSDMSSKWDKWLYENDKYAVIAPKCSGELAREGLRLRHCVRSYIGRVVNNITNILFIREKIDLDKPFFTVEVTNDSVIQQVHGFGNRNSDTEPGLDDFIKEWVKVCKMKTSNFNKVR